MNYNFIEIGTSDFDTLIQQCSDDQTGLSIEPIGYYLNRLPDKPNVKKIQAAVSSEEGFLDIYYISDENIQTYALPFWVRGSNSINKPHAYTMSQIGTKIYDRLVTIEKVRTITWKTLIKDYDVSSIEFLKIDTEGWVMLLMIVY